MVLTSTRNLCFEQKYEKYQSFLSENFQFWEVKFSIYLNRHVFVMDRFSSLFNWVNIYDNTNNLCKLQKNWIKSVDFIA